MHLDVLKRQALAPFICTTAGFSVDDNGDFLVDIRKKFDAIVYVDLTTPTHPLQ